MSLTISSTAALRGGVEIPRLGPVQGLRHDTWRALERLRADGRARAVAPPSGRFTPRPPVL